MMMRFYTNTFCFIVAFCLFAGVAFGQANPFQKVDTTKARLKIKYKNQNSAVDLALDVNEQEFYLEFNGKDLQSNLMNPEDTIVKKDKKTDLSKTDKEPIKKIDANKMLRFYRLAQDAYSKKTYDISLSYIDSSMFYGESSDALGLKGSVYFTKGEVELAKRVWEQAKVLDKDFKVPVINQKYIRK
ncbi:MAG: hypothetical protein ACOVJ4_05895 [Sphingobacteriaceae bacterium]